MKWLALDYIATTKSCVSTAFFPGAGMSFFFFLIFYWTVIQCGPSVSSRG